MCKQNVKATKKKILFSVVIKMKNSIANQIDDEDEAILRNT